MMIIVLLILLYLYLIFPNLKRKDSLEPYTKRYIAHRGLFNNRDVPENSLMAFRKAVKNGYGIELDVQLTTDNRLVVFHDASLYRMTGIDKNLTECSYEELLSYRLLNTNEKIPLFSDVLQVLHPDTPLVVEIKAEGRYIETTKRTVEMMRNYKGLYNMESFNPMVVRYLRVHEPQIIRGQLSYNYLSDKKSPLHPVVKFTLTNLLLNFYTRPDYIAYDCVNYRNLSLQIISRFFNGFCVAWTVKSQEQLEILKKHYQCFIFDSFIPKQ
ncbi:MAG: hypothetical protein IJI44_07025 [Erysipelotrichaceae bacterium]|nr:hypothetical protein [Erysipelotrichaceae bacterium]